MADEAIPAGTIQIEDTEEAPVVPAPVETPVVAAPGAPAADAEIDLSDPELAKDQKRISGLIAELSRKREEVRTLKPKAERADQLETYVNDSKPYVEFLKANPELLKPRTVETPAPQTPQEDPDALEAAQLMDFYTSDGKPDVTRGAKWLALQEKRTARVAQQQMQPWQTQSAQDRAGANYQMALNARDADGKAIDKQFIDLAWRHILSEPNGLHSLADPKGAAFILAAAAGMERFGRKSGPAAPLAAPIHTESGGGGPVRPRAVMSEQSANIAHERGWTAEKYQQLTKGHVKGRPAVLEDD